MKSIIFPGQGSQFQGMGKDLFDLFPQQVEVHDTALGYSLKDLCLNNPDNKLKNTQYTQPALFTVNYLTYLNYLQENEAPEYLAGHSLGEYNALLASNVFDFETGLQLVKKRGELMASAEQGGMAAVINLSEKKIKSILDDNNISNLEIANINTPSQIVISGDKSAIIDYQNIFTSAGAHYVVLPVSGAFHSTLMNASAELYYNFIKSFQFNSPKIPVISNITAEPYPNSRIASIMAAQVTSSVKWSKSIQYLMYKGVDEFQEMGPGNILTGLVAKIQKESVESDFEFKDELDVEISHETTQDIIDSSDTISNDTHDDIIAKDVEIDLSPKQEFKTISLGSKHFLKRYNVKYPYISGGMYRGIASKEMVVAMGINGFIGFLGTGGVSLKKVEQDIEYLKNELGSDYPFGVNFLHNENDPEYENKVIDLFIKHGVFNIEASAFITITSSLVQYRLQGLTKTPDGEIQIRNSILAKVSRPEIASLFLQPAPQELVDELLRKGKITQEEALLSKEIPLAGELCVESDSGGHTDAGNLSVLFPAIKSLQEETYKSYHLTEKTLVGAAGGIGTPSSAAAAFILGADFILTGSINQCTVEASISNEVKDILETINVQDTAYAPAGDMFEIGAKVQVLKKGVLFPSRANKLYDLYRQYNSIDEISKPVIQQLEKRFFKKSIDEVWDEVVIYYKKKNIEELELAQRSKKHKMALIFKWYFHYSTKVALEGDLKEQVNFQVHCGPSLGAFNQWVKGTKLEKWHERNVHVIAIKILDETRALIEKQLKKIIRV